MSEQRDPRADAVDPRAARVGILTADVDLVIRSWDAALARMTGIPAERAVGQRIDELAPEIRERGLVDYLREPLVSGAAQVLAPALHGHLIPCLPLEPSTEFETMRQRVVIGVLRDNERTVGIVVTIEDVTARLEHERQLARQLRDADPATRAAAVERLSRLEPTDGVGPLGDALGDEDWQVRRRATRALAARRDAQLVDAVVTALRDGHRNFSLLSSALQLLTVTGIDVTEALIGLLQDQDADLRLQAALALGSQRAPAAVPALIGALADADPNVRFHAVEALGRLASADAIEPLVAIAESGDFFLAFPAIEALVRISDPSIAPRLVPLLQDPMLAGPVAEALAQIGDEEVVRPLVAALVRPGAPVVPIVDALAQIHRRAQETVRDGGSVADTVARVLTPGAAERILDAIPHTSGAHLRSLVIVVGWLRGPAIQRALAQLLGASAVHHEAIEALVRFGAPAVDLLVEQLGREEGDTRRAAVVALGRIGDRRAVPALVGLLGPGTRDLWVAVAGALARIGDGGAFEPLLGLLGDPDAAIRQAAIGALNSIGHPQMSRRIRVLLDSPHPRVRESAVRIAGYFGYPECVEQLLRRTEDEDEAVRAAAVEHLPYVESGVAFEALRRAVAADTPRVRAAATHALGHLDVADASALLRDALRDADSWVRYFSAISLGRQRDARALDALASLVTSDPAHHVRVAAVDAIGAIGGPDVVRLLAPLATGEDGELAAAALRVLGRVGGAGAAVPLREALRSADAGRRRAAAEALAAWCDVEAVDLLQWTFSGDADEQVVRAALGGLVAIGSTSGPAAPRAVAALVASLPDPHRRGDVMPALSHLPSCAIPWIARALRSDDGAVRRGVVEVLGRMPHPSASAYLQRALDDDDAAVRQRAVVALARLGTRGVTRRLARIAQSDPVAAVRDAARAAVERQEPSEGDDVR